MRRLSLAILLASPLLFGGVDGVVTNATSGKPQAGATVTLFQTSQQGPQFINSVKTDAAGKFVFTDNVAPGQGGGPLLLQAVYGGVQYNKMMPPGTPTSGVEIPVYDSSKKPGEAVIEQHMLLLEPSPDGMLNVSESYVFRNNGKTAWNDPDNGTLQFALPAAAQGKVEINALAPGGVPIRKAADPGPKPNTFKLDFPIKPGESRIDLAWSMPFQSPGVFENTILSKGGQTRIVAPVGVTFKGGALKDLGQEPRTKATIWGVEGSTLKFTVEGTGALSDPAADQSSGGGDANAGQPALAMLLPKLYGLAGGSENFLGQIMAVKWVLGSVLTMLAVAFALLYRKSATAEGTGAETSQKAPKNARGRS